MLLSLKMEDEALVRSAHKNLVSHFSLGFKKTNMRDLTISAQLNSIGPLWKIFILKFLSELADQERAEGTIPS